MDEAKLSEFADGNRIWIPTGNRTQSMNAVASLQRLVDDDCGILCGVVPESLA